MYNVKDILPTSSTLTSSTLSSAILSSASQTSSTTGNLLPNQVIEFSKKLNQFIEEISSTGGGQILFPSGVYEAGTIELKSNITLFLEKGAILRASSVMEHFPPIGYVHNEMGDVRSFIFSRGCENFSILGEGVIDLNGEHWYDPSRPVIPKDSLVPFTQKQISECTWDYNERINQPMFFLDSHHFSIKDITILDAPCWTISLAASSNVMIHNITIKNHPNIPNNDGVHICASSKVTISNCTMECADDCVAISSIIDWDIPSEDIIISDCQFKSHSKAIVIGYMQSIVRNVVIQNMIIRESNRGICIMSSQGDGLVENVRVNNCIIETRIRAGNWWGNGEPIFLMGTYHHGYKQEVDRDWPVNIRNVIFSSIACIGENALGIIGQNNNIEGITLRDVSLVKKESENIPLKGNVFCLAPSKRSETIPQDHKEYGIVIRNAADITLENISLQHVNGKECCIYIPKLALRNKV